MRAVLLIILRAHQVYKTNKNYKEQTKRRSKRNDSKIDTPVVIALSALDG